MTPHVFARNVADQRRAIAAWGGGLLLLVLMYLAIYPSIQSSGVDIQRLLDQMPPALREAFLGAGVDYNTPTGYLGTELFAFLLPALLLVIAIVAGSRGLAGEESGGTIDLLLATPLPRHRLVIEKAMAVCLPIPGLAVLVWVVVAAVGPSFGVLVHLGALAVAITAVTLMAMGFGLLAFLVAGATGHRGAGAGAAGSGAVALYALNAIGPSVPGLKGVAAVLSPFHWCGGPGVLASGVPWSGLAALMVAPLALLLLTWFMYERRDVTC